MSWLKQNWIKVGVEILILGVLFFIKERNSILPSTALIIGATPAFLPTSTETVALEDGEKRFKDPISITWNAKVLGCLVSCLGYSFQNLDPKAKYAYFQGYDDILDERYLDLRNRTFQVKGQWTGIDCAYKNTVFGGQCTPSIEITEMKESPKNSVDWFSEELVKVASKDYMFTDWRTAGNASQNVTFSLWDLDSNSKTYASKSYSFYADYNFRKDELYTGPCGGPEYSKDANIGEVGNFFRDKILQFQKENGWPKQCLGL